jgi:hypothetical protein
MINRRHKAIAVCGTCAAILIGSATISRANPPSSQPSGVPAATRPHPALHLTDKQIAALAEIQQGAIDAGLHPGVFGPREASVAPAVLPRAIAPSASFHWRDAGIGASGTLALALIACAAALTVARRRRHRAHEQRAG